MNTYSSKFSFNLFSIWFQNFTDFKATQTEIWNWLEKNKKQIDIMYTSLRSMHYAVKESLCSVGLSILKGLLLFLTTSLILHVSHFYTISVFNSVS